MEISLKSLTLLSALFVNGLSAGLFYAWQISVIPGTQKIMDTSYLETMQSINRAILNPAFYLIFFGGLVLLCISSVQQYNSGLSFWLILGATLSYLLGTFGVTIFGNVPLNDALDVLDLAEMTADGLQSFRQQYEQKWNRFHLIRTVFSLLSFVLSILSVFFYSQQ